MNEPTRRAVHLLVIKFRMVLNARWQNAMSETERNIKPHTHMLTHRISSLFLSAYIEYRNKRNNGFTATACRFSLLLLLDSLNAPEFLFSIRCYTLIRSSPSECV